MCGFVRLRSAAWLAAAKVVSREPVRYVRNIYKYYVAYRMLSEQAAGRRAAKEAAKSL